MGTSQDFTRKVAAEICKRMMKGESLSSICRDDFMPPRWQVYEWLTADTEFANSYARAMDIRADHIFDDIFEIADDASHDTVADEDGHERLNAEHVQRSRLRIDTRKWALARMNPRKYGDKIEVDNKSSDGSMTPTRIENVMVKAKPADG